MQGYGQGAVTGAFTMGTRYLDLGTTVGSPTGNYTPLTLTATNASRTARHIGLKTPTTSNSPDILFTTSDPRCKQQDRWHPMQCDLGTVEPGASQSVTINIHKAYTKTVCKAFPWTGQIITSGQWAKDETAPAPTCRS